MAVASIVPSGLRATKGSYSRYTTVRGGRGGKRKSLSTRSTTTSWNLETVAALNACSEPSLPLNASSLCSHLGLLSPGTYTSRVVARFASCEGLLETGVPVRPSLYTDLRANIPSRNPFMDFGLEQRWISSMMVSANGISAGFFASASVLFFASASDKSLKSGWCGFFGLGLIRCLKGSSRILPFFPFFLSLVTTMNVLKAAPSTSIVVRITRARATSPFLTSPCLSATSTSSSWPSCASPRIVHMRTCSRQASSTDLGTTIMVFASSRRGLILYTAARASMAVIVLPVPTSCIRSRLALRSSHGVSSLATLRIRCLAATTWCA